MSKDMNYCEFHGPSEYTYGRNLNIDQHDTRKRNDVIQAAHINSFESLQHAVELGGDINSVDEDGNTPLHLVCANSYSPRCLRYLLTLRPNVNARNNLLETPLNIYLRNFYLEDYLVNLFLMLGADPNIPDAKGNTAFHNLAKCAAHELICLNRVAEILIKFNAKVNVQNEDGDTPLHLAVCKRSVYFVRTLLNNGASILIKNKENITPMDLAYNRREMNQEIFREMGKNIIILQRCNIAINQDILRELHSTVRLESFDEECKKEVLKAKAIKFGHGKITLFDILNSSTNTFAKYLRRSEIIESFQNNISHSFGILRNHLEHHFRESLARKEAEDDAVPICINIFEILNEDCIKHLITFLGKDDLDNIKSAYMRRNLQET